MSHTNNDMLISYEELSRGYIEMSSINLEEADAGLSADNEALEICEENLMECE